MDLTNKNELINWLFLPKNNSILKQIETLRNRDVVEGSENSNSPFAKEELIERALKSEADIKAGRVMIQKEFENAE